MKMLLASTLSILLSTGAMASDYYVTTIDWNAPYLEDNTVLQCDDSFALGVEIQIPGTSKFPEGSISYDDCGVDWKITQKKTVNLGGKAYNSIRFEGRSSCTIKVHGKNDLGERKVFVLDIGDAC